MKSGDIQPRGERRVGGHGHCCRYVLRHLKEVWVGSLFSFQLLLYILPIFNVFRHVLCESFCVSSLLPCVCVGGGGGRVWGVRGVGGGGGGGWVSGGG